MLDNAAAMIAQEGKTMAKRIEPRYECIAYLSVEADLNVVDRLEDKQLKYIKEYAKAHNTIL